MQDNLSAFDSVYIIDGIRKELTPGQMLMECMPYPCTGTGIAAGSIMDETVDRTPVPFAYDRNDLETYLRCTTKALSGQIPFRMQYPAAFTRQRIAFSLIEAIWKDGHFRLDNLMITALWTWNPGQIGNMAVFYESAREAAEYIYDLGIGLEEYSFHETDGPCMAEFRISEAAGADEDDADEPYISEKKMCPCTLSDDESSWLIYVPFDSCPFRLGGSLLAESCGHNGGKAPEIRDPDYFMDCYEIIRELVEDGVILSGATVGDGGMMTAVAGMCGNAGIGLDMEGIKAAYQEDDIVRILFSEVPGVLIQIDDSDFDYIDAQMLLQDIAYYPLGHPSKSVSGVKVPGKGRSGVADILASLMKGQSSEGED